MQLPDRDEDCCDRCGIELTECTCFGPAIKWGGIKRVTFNAGWPDRPIFDTVSAFVFGDDGQHVHIQMPGDKPRLIASSRIITIEEAWA